jgi:membrane-bound lytic murein transglycosylase A
MRFAWGAVLTALALSACAGPATNLAPSAEKLPPMMQLAPVSFDVVPGWRLDHMSEAIPALLHECAMFDTLPGDTAVGGEGTADQLGGRAEDWRPLCSAAKALPSGDDEAARAMLERELQAYEITDRGNAQGLFTGYYEPEVAGALRRSGKYRVPLLRPPADLIDVKLGDFAPDLKGRSIWGRVGGNQLVPYYDRAQIEAGALAAQHLELLFLSDPVDAFFLEIQGAGRVRLRDGRIVRVAYAGQNGHPYVPIGRLLVERGELVHDKVSMQTIRMWLKTHPDQAKSVMDANPSYVFFRTLADRPTTEGPPGAFGVSLSPNRSMAVDRRFLPFGAPVFVATTNPINDAPWQHLLLAQDTGGAIKGPVRGDIFFGWSAEAETMAGRMQQKGNAYILLPRGPSH